ncbi:hypothetical protein SODALDRAFT_76589 [Sodiomyces alkalinus F11]|uniref:Uncharacterized protein n=1 Tax=Sodiomyces alkalinus (strain CBS 110278 / VKM F-3762 / F11) TaxID=1314773 RepID=A0A3N2PKF0_SODAK|nr:hypothetical protein SODALDRAFT_76589 [Sodiomyces alkalinus F11]ROT35022.1 hypothetical protein SODALDRAFT_76589 [Sodiomyces alkalinus F11]
MAPAAPTSSTTAASSLHHAIRQQSFIPRRLFRIPGDQRALLDRPDSWFNPSVNTTKPYFNVPPAVLDDLKARILPPPAQKPLSSSASTEATSSKKRKAIDDGHDEGQNRASSPVSSSESSEGIPISSWPPSPPRPIPPPADIQKPVDDSEDSETALSQALPTSSPPQRTDTNARKPISQVVMGENRISNWQSDVILSQSPLPEPKDALRNLQPSSTPDKLGTFASVAQTQSQAAHVPLPSPLVQRTLATLIPPSSSVPDELEAEIPDALFRATPPINKTSVSIAGKVTFANTPPCGQGSMVPSTYTVAQSPPKQDPSRRRRPMKRIKFDDSPGCVVSNTVKRTPNPGQGIPAESRTPANPTMSTSSSPISATFPPPRTTVKPVPSDKPEAAKSVLEPCEKILPAQQSKNDECNAPARSDLPGSVNSPTVAQRITETDTITERDPTRLEPNLDESFWREPLEAFRSAYDSFRGSLGDFVRACLSIKSLRRERKLPVFLYDDFIRIFCDDYIRYIEQTDDDPPLYAMECRVFEVHAKEYHEARKALGFSRSPTVDKSFSLPREEAPKTAKGLALPSESAATKASKPPAGPDTSRPASRPQGSAEPLRERPLPLHAEEQLAVQDVQDTHVPRTAGDAAPVINLVDSNRDSSEAAVEMEDARQQRDSTTVANEDGDQSTDRAAPIAEKPENTSNEQQPPPDPDSRRLTTQHDGHQPRTRQSMPPPPPGHHTPIKAKSRVLPPSFALTTPEGASRATRRTTLPPRGAVPTGGPSPASSAYSTLTVEAGGVRKNKKKESRQERFRRHLQKLKEEGRLPGQASSTAPPRQ